MPDSTKKPDILFISGSPRSRTCVALIDLLEQGAKSAGAKTQRFLLSKKHILPCTGCEGCMETGICVQANKTQSGHLLDDYLELKATLERVDAIAIVAPLYFAGPPSQLKALYDRFQPYWVKRYVLGEQPAPKRPAQLFVVGGSPGDAHGYAPLAGITKSAVAVAGFNLEKVNNFVGFLAKSDAPVLPDEDDWGHFTHSQIAHIRRETVKQTAFVQRAVGAGGAYTRYIIKKQQQADQLAATEQTAQEHAEKVVDIPPASAPDLPVLPDIPDTPSPSPDSAA
ncbi:MAG: flavodoxin family protein [Coriobacteriales bacterium]|jgi:multimeric flavodoxin WrbA|nr:flavodoxin family protein [Coriobacteriales bacterium]